MKKILSPITLLMICLGAYAQIEHPVKWAYGAKKTSGTEAVIFLKADIQPGWHTYALNVKQGGPIKTSVTFTPSKAYSLAGNLVAPTAASKYDKNFKMNIGYFEREVVFQQKIWFKSANSLIVKGKLEYMTCNDIRCNPPEEINFAIPLSDKD